MRSIMESLFVVAYLICGAVLCISLMRRSPRGDALRLYGIMCLVLVCGDAFHLVPRIIALNSPLGMDGYTAALGIGKLITSVTMTVFYVLLHEFRNRRFGRVGRAADIAVYALAAARVALCLFPQNMWTSADAPVSWGIYRNIPFALLGLLIVVLYARTARGDRNFRFMPLAVTLSFAFYIPVVLWADVSPMIGMLMIPKTCCYVWIMAMGCKSR